MTETGTQTPPAPEILKRGLSSHLFPQEEGMNTYAVLDGASIPDLLDHLYGEVRPEFVCLYRGELEPDMAECAPYLAVLKPDAPFTDWLLTEGWGKHWGIFAVSRADLKTVQKHFRTFLMVKDPDGKQLYFRYYDPRVFRVYLPTCNQQETTIVFGPVQHYLIEDENPATLIRFSPEQTPPRMEAINLISS
jgi:hypothetical protein